MTNTAMPIPAIISSPSAPAVCQSENSAPEKPFNQVLNKEVAARQQKNAVKNEAPAPSKQSEPAIHSVACADAGASAMSAAAHAGKTDKTTKENKTEEKQAAEDNACGAIPTALLEMVASLTHRPDLAQAAAPAAKSADDAISDAAPDANKPDISRLAGDLHSSKGAKADFKQSADLTGDPAAAVSAHTNEPAPSLQSAKAEAVELRKAMLSATDSQPAHQSADAAVQPMVLPNLPSAGRRPFDAGGRHPGLGSGTRTKSGLDGGRRRAKRSAQPEPSRPRPLASGAECLECAGGRHLHFRSARSASSSGSRFAQVARHAQRCGHPARTGFGQCRHAAAARRFRPAGALVFPLLRFRRRCRRTGRGRRAEPRLFRHRHGRHVRLTDYRTSSVPAP